MRISTVHVEVYAVEKLEHEGWITVAFESPFLKSEETRLSSNETELWEWHGPLNTFLLTKIQRLLTTERCFP